MDRGVRREGTRWGTPRKRALFGPDGPDSMSSGSDVAEAQLRWPPDGKYPAMALSGRPYNDESLEEARSPMVELEDAVAQLQKELVEYRKEGAGEFFPDHEKVVVPSVTVAQVRGCTRMRGNGHSPGETQDAREVVTSPGEKCAEEPGYIRPVLVAGPPVYAWVVTWSLLFGSPPKRVRGFLRPPLLCQLRFNVPAVFRCVRVIDTLMKSRLCRQCSFPPRDLTWIVLVLVWLSCRLVWWSIMTSGKSGKLPAVDQAGASPTHSTPLPGTFLGLTLDLGSDRLYDLVKDIPDVMGLWALSRLL